VNARGVAVLVRDEEVALAVAQELRLLASRELTPEMPREL
jgi:hypothetical protein